MSFDAPPLYEGDLVRRLRFGTQLDARPIATARRTDDPDRALTPEQVAGYLAKYATKSATDSTNTDSPHARRLRATIADVTDRIHADARADETPLREHPYAAARQVAAHARLPRPLLHQVPPLLDHPRTLRRARVRYQRRLAAAHREGRTLDVRDLDDLLADDAEETTLVIGQWTYAGSGWDTDGDAELAKAAAARAREYAQWKAAQGVNSSSPQGNPSRGEGQ